MEFPQYAASKWVGHSITVSGKHYANDVPEELFERAAAVGGSDVAEQAVQNPVQHPAATGRNASQLPDDRARQEAQKPADCERLREITATCESGGKWSRGESNPRAGTVNRSRLHA